MRSAMNPSAVLTSRAPGRDRWPSPGAASAAAEVLQRNPAPGQAGVAPRPGSPSVCRARETLPDLASQQLRRAAAPPLWAGVAYERVACDLGVTPCQLAAAHATLFDVAESPLKARRLRAEVQVLHRVLALPGTLHGQGHGWRAALHCGGRDAPVLAAAARGLQLFALQSSSAATALQWFDAQGEPVWRWQPAEGLGAAFDDLVRRCGHADLRPTPVVAGRPQPARTPVVSGVPKVALLPPGAGWDLLLHAAAQGLPLQLAFGLPVDLRCAPAPMRVCLEGRVLGVRLGAHAVWLDESSVWTVDERQASANVGGLCLRPDDAASRTGSCVWRTALAAALHDQPVPPCSC